MEEACDRGLALLEAQRAGLERLLRQQQKAGAELLERHGEAVEEHRRFLLSAGAALLAKPGSGGLSGGAGGPCAPRPPPIRTPPWALLTPPPPSARELLLEEAGPCPPQGRAQAWVGRREEGQAVGRRPTGGAAVSVLPPRRVLQPPEPQKPQEDQEHNVGTDSEPESSACSTESAVPGGVGAGTRGRCTGWLCSDWRRTHLVTQHSQMLKELHEEIQREKDYTRKRTQRQSQVIRPNNRLQERLLPVIGSTTHSVLNFVLIVANAFLLGIALEKDMASAMRTAPEDWIAKPPELSESGKNALLETLEKAKNALLHEVSHEELKGAAEVLIICMILDVVLRLLGEQREFFVGHSARWNIFDMVTVGLIAIDEVIFQRAVSCLRLLRIIRLMRIIQLFRFLSKFRQMLFSFISCLKTLIWALFFTFFYIYMFAIFLEYIVVDYVTTVKHVDKRTMDALRKNWNGVLHAVRSLIYSVTGGVDWGEICEPFWAISSIAGCTFVAFISFTTLGLLNILVGIFAQEAGELAHWDRDLVLDAASTRRGSMVKVLEELFKEIDEDDSGEISLSELKASLHNPQVKDYFSHLQVDFSHEPEVFFQQLDTTEDGIIRKEEFVKSCLRLQGAAKPSEVAKLGLQSRQMLQLLQKLDCDLGRLLGRGTGDASNFGEACLASDSTWNEG